MNKTYISIFGIVAILMVTFNQVNSASKWNLKCPSIDFHCGGDLLREGLPVSSWQECGRQCKEDDVCTVWSWYNNDNRCWLKYGCSNVVYDNSISGEWDCYA